MKDYQAAAIRAAIRAYYPKRTIQVNLLGALRALRMREKRLRRNLEITDGMLTGYHSR